MSRENKKIFIIEDEATMLLGMQAKFSTEGFSPEAHDGTGELVNLTDRIKIADPDLIVLDIILSDIDGFELLASIRADQDIGWVPVFVYSNLSDQESRQRCSRLGSEYFFVKSELNIDEFVNKVKKIIENRNKIINQ